MTTEKFQYRLNAGPWIETTQSLLYSLPGVSFTDPLDVQAVGNMASIVSNNPSSCSRTRRVRALSMIPMQLGCYSKTPLAQHLQTSSVSLSGGSTI